MNNGTEYVYGKGENLNYNDNSFDIYITDNVLDHVDDHKAFVSEIHRVLKKGGIAVSTRPTPSFLAGKPDVAYQ
jgi:ubiquinone/menaquinone biosynthesis C-methylase UbiE